MSAAEPEAPGDADPNSRWLPTAKGLDIKALSRRGTGYGHSFGRCDAVTRMVIFGCLGMALFGYDTGIVSGAMVLLREDVSLNDEEAEIVVSITLIFSAISTVLGIPLNSLFGRKPVIIAAALLYIGGSVVVATAAGFAGLVAGRSLLGIAIGFASGTVPMYSAELAPPEMRGMVVTLNDLNIVFGQLIAAMANVCVKHVTGGWRWSMGFAAAPAAILFFGFVFLPESPRWLVMKGKVADGEAVLRMIHGRDDVAACLQYISEAVQREVGSTDVRKGRWALLNSGVEQVLGIWGTKEVRRAAILGISLMAMNQLSGINTVMYYSSTILIGAGFSRDASIWLAAMCCAAQLAGVCISVASMDSHGRRATALRSCAGVIVTLMLLATSFWCKGPGWEYVRVIALALYLIAFGSGLSGVPWVMNSEIYPLRLRSAAVGQATVACWLFNWVVGRYFLSICKLVGTGGAFSIFACVSIIGGVWLYFMLPETMGLELESVGILFQDPYPKVRAKAAPEVDGLGAEVDSDESEGHSVIGKSTSTQST